ncbi:NADPH:quinone reductase [Streptomyces carminius]|uniref:NADPH:quinone reductase n=1 Tax=Streptomyces carminius TaxID=2665496 RepID=A0A2M8M6C7_9ACTN|nr:zinc-binding dehydrogenase [Streptomyces carminius]PJE99760.1 NADPH:quinone reductase [Streptomyces carminius]
MRAVRVAEFGPPEVLRVAEVPDPVPGHDEVLVDVAAAGVQFVETLVRAGRSAAVPRPYTPGRDVAGVVRAVGPGVDPALVGTRVSGQTASSGGGYAERAVLPRHSLHPLPGSVSLRDATCLLGPGLTAVSLVEAARVRAGETVLVEAAAGGVGSLLVQLAKIAGARVIGAARGRKKLALAEELGADATVDYGVEGWADRARRAAGGRGVDVVWDSVGGAVGRRAVETLAPGGRFVVYGIASGSGTEIPGALVYGRGLTVIGYGAGNPVIDHSRRHALQARALAEAAVGRLRPVVGQCFPLEEAPRAHEALTARATVGKVLLIP